MPTKVEKLYKNIYGTENYKFDLLAWIGSKDKENIKISCAKLQIGVIRTRPTYIHLKFIKHEF